MQLIKFIVVGSSAAAVHLLTLWLLVNQSLFMPLVANAIAFALAFLFSYLGQSLWTFNHKEHQPVGSLLRFLVVQLLCSFALNQGLYTFLLAVTSLNYLIASLIVLSTVPLVTFTLSKYWAFK